MIWWPGKEGKSRRERYGGREGLDRYRNKFIFLDAKNHKSMVVYSALFFQQMDSVQQAKLHLCSGPPSLPGPKPTKPRKPNCMGLFFFFFVLFREISGLIKFIEYHKKILGKYHTTFVALLLTRSMK
jgi:hypothetical protein